MERRHSWISLLVAVPGVMVCVVALVGFFRRVVSNSLPFHAKLTASEYYQAVGQAYGRGFVVGFFLCFFLMLGVLAAFAIAERRRKPRALPADDWAKQPVVFPGPSGRIRN